VIKNLVASNEHTVPPPLR